MNAPRSLLALVIAGMLCATAAPAIAAKPPPRHPTEITSFTCSPTYGTGPTAVFSCDVVVLDTSPEPTAPTGSISVTSSPDGGSTEYALIPTAGDGAASAWARFGISTSVGEHTVTVSYGGDSEHAPSSRSETFVVPPRYDPPEAGSLPPDTWFWNWLPRRTTRHRITFLIGGAYEAGFECKLDQQVFRPCRSPFSRRVGIGRHRLAVRAVAANGSVDPTPAAFRWRVVRR